MWWWVTQQPWRTHCQQLSLISGQHTSLSYHVIFTPSILHWFVSKKQTLINSVSQTKHRYLIKKCSIESVWMTLNSCKASLIKVTLPSISPPLSHNLVPGYASVLPANQWGAGHPPINHHLPGSSQCLTMSCSINLSTLLHFHTDGIPCWVVACLTMTSWRSRYKYSSWTF